MFTGISSAAAIRDCSDVSKLLAAWTAGLAITGPVDIVPAALDTGLDRVKLLYNVIRLCQTIKK